VSVAPPLPRGASNYFPLFLSTVNPRIGEDSMEDLFHALDTDGNGIIDLGEWKKIAEKWEHSRSFIPVRYV
jgi:hypothetical protein